VITSDDFFAISDLVMQRYNPVATYCGRSRYSSRKTYRSIKTCHFCCLGAHLLP
jgi:hypothetical protein